MKRRSSKFPLLIAATALSAVAIAAINNDKAQSDIPLKSKNELLLPAAKQISLQVPKAKAILQKWRSENPEKGERKLHIVLWTPSDKEFAAKYQERLEPILENIQAFYAKEMARLGFGPKHSIGLDYNGFKKLKIHLVKGKNPYSHYKVASGGEIRRECIASLKAAGINPKTETIVLFCNMSVWDPKKRAIRQNSPYYAAGSSTSGTAWQVDSPILNLEDLTNKQANQRVFDGQYGYITLGKYNTIFIGGIAHELGHALGLPHNAQRSDEAKEFGIALMGNGNRAYGDQLRGEGKGAFLTLAHGLKLASHPMFSGFVARMNEKPQTKVSNLKFSQTEHGFKVTGKVTGTIPPYAVLAYMDPDGGSDYDAKTTSAVPNPDGTFELHCTELKKNAHSKLNLTFVHANGKATSWHRPGKKYSYSYSVDHTGKLDLSKMIK